MSLVPDHADGRSPDTAAERATWHRSGSLDVGATVGEAFAIFGRRFVQLVMLMLAILVPLTVVLYEGVVVLQRSGHGAGTVAAIAISLIIYVVASYLAQTAATVAVFDDLRRRPFSIGNGLRVTARRLLPVLGVTVLASMAVLLGSLLLIVPGIMLMLAFYVAVPVCAVERTGAAASLRRSRMLTRGQRWRIFAVYVVVTLVTAVGSHLIDNLESTIGAIPDLVLGTLWEALTGAFGAVLTAVVYYRLRILKEGVDVAAIADVFD